MSPEACPTLVLNADFRPLSYFPLSLWSWQDAVRAVILDRVNPVSEYDRRVSSPSLTMRLPSVVSLKTYVRAVRTPAFTRFNVFLRDGFACQYCAEQQGHGFGRDVTLTFDHLLPRSRGGRTTWQNVVSACGACNLKKGDRLAAEVDMWPRQMPFRPSVFDLQRNGRRFPPNYLHESWHDFLYWDSVLEP